MLISTNSLYILHFFGSAIIKFNYNPIKIYTYSYLPVCLVLHILSLIKTMLTGFKTIGLLTGFDTILTGLELFSSIGKSCPLLLLLLHDK